MASQPNACTNEDCSFAIDSKCVEGYPLEECPHLTRIAVEDIKLDEEMEVAPTEMKVVALDLGEALSRAEASSMQARRVSRVVGIIGPNDAGKTSLLASVYDLLQEGPLAGVGFAGSSTLIGFEKVCHDARVTSRRNAPYTERTTQGVDATFFHLDLRPNDGEIVSLFIGDRSGEDYLAASDDLSSAAEFFELRRADVVTLLVNGEHLASSENRHEAKATTPQIVDALVEARSFRKGCRVAIVLTKHDAVLASPHEERVQRDFDEIVDSIIATHGVHLGEIDRFVVAASPKNATKVKRGDGVDRLLHFWLHDTPTPAPVPRAFPDSARMIDLLDSRNGASA
jgi:hypothetical protein